MAGVSRAFDRAADLGTGARDVPRPCTSILVTGPIGSGKTRILRELERDSPGGRRALYVPVPSLDFDGIATWCLGMLGLPEGDDPATTLREQIATMDGGLLLLIDDTEHLPAETASRLGSLIAEFDGRLTVVATALSARRETSRLLRTEKEVSLSLNAGALLRLAELRELIETGHARAPMARVAPLPRPSGSRAEPSETHAGTDSDEETPAPDETVAAREVPEAPASPPTAVETGEAPEADPDPGPRAEVPFLEVDPELELDPEDQPEPTPAEGTAPPAPEPSGQADLTPPIPPEPAPEPADLAPPTQSEPAPEPIQPETAASPGSVTLPEAEGLPEPVSSAEPAPPPRARAGAPARGAVPRRPAPNTRPVGRATRVTRYAVAAVGLAVLVFASFEFGRRTSQSAPLELGEPSRTLPTVALAPPAEEPPIVEAQVAEPAPLVALEPEPIVTDETIRSPAARQEATLAPEPVPVPLSPRQETTPTTDSAPSPPALEAAEPPMVAPAEPDTSTPAPLPEPAATASAAPLPAAERSVAPTAATAAPGPLQTAPAPDDIFETAAMLEPILVEVTTRAPLVESVDPVDSDFEFTAQHDAGPDAGAAAAGSWLEIRMVRESIRAQIWLDGENIGRTPSPRLSLEPGRHRVTLRLPSGRKVRHAFELEADRGTRMLVRAVPTQDPVRLGPVESDPSSAP